MTAAPAEAGLDALIEFLKGSRGFDFTGYKRPSLERRFRRRMDAVGCAGYGDYLDFLEVHPEELPALFDTLLINVTAFFREPKAWQHLQESALPPVLEQRRDDEPIRVWCAGCASGEEAYSTAIVLAELLGDQAYRERVKIYGTDLDDAALTVARQAVYSGKELESVPEPLRDRYFKPADRKFAFRQDLRRNVIFGRNNLLQDAPISSLDLLVCRNTLMYFTAETQARILRNFHFALRSGGVLMLGKSEMMLSHRDKFEAIDLGHRIFRTRSGTPPLPARVARMADEAVPAGGEARESRDAALEAGAQPLIIVDRSGVVTLANRAAREAFDIPDDAVGRLFRELAVSYRPMELLGPVEEAVREGRPVLAGETPFRPPGDGAERLLDVTVTPLLAEGVTLGVAIVFEDVSRFAAAQQELEGNRRDLELAYEELQSTIDELETTNEELQSANEELQTTNEELQSTNEELETMNEELQSTNEELETINDELRDRTGELNEVNEFLEAILGSLEVAVAVIDRQQRVQIWNQWAEELWGMRQDEAVDHHFLTLDSGLPTEKLVPALRRALSDGGERVRVELDAVNRRGRAITCIATVMPLRPSGGPDGGAHGAIVLMQDVDPDNGMPGRGELPE
jgi:two-component system, chemotaxis family, CheB/CheR fusion protein